MTPEPQVDLSIEQAEDIMIRLRRLYDETGLSLLSEAMTDIAANRGAAAMYEALLQSEPRASTVTSHAELAEAAVEILADHMTSEKHHPGYVLVPVAAFNKLRAALAHNAAAGGSNGLFP
jgi:hypothetical protein